jgi:hypothetical protein
MHDIILEDLSSLHGLSDEQDLANFLRELRPTARYLWQAYRSSVVKISYRKPVLQAAYMLRYFPYHAEITIQGAPLRSCRNRCVITLSLCYSSGHARDALLNAWLFPPSPC